VGRFVRIAASILAALTLASATLLVTPGPSVRASDPPREGSVAVLQGDGGTFTTRDQTGAEVWQVNSGWDLHQYLYRASNPLNFAIDVDRHFGPVDADGHPAPGNGLYRLTGRISLRVFDVDDDPPPQFGPEVDEVYING